MQELEGSLNVPVSETVTRSNNATYMIENKNKHHRRLPVGDPEVHRQLDPQLAGYAGSVDAVHPDSYGRQKPKKYNYQVNWLPAAKPARSVYAVVGASATYDLTKNVSVTAGIDNLFDKRQFRAGNAQNVGDPITGAINIAGAGAATYNEPGRTTT